MGTCRAIIMKECHVESWIGCMCHAHLIPDLPKHPLRSLRIAYERGVDKGGAHAQAVEYLARAVNARLVAKQISAEADDLYRAAVKRQKLSPENPFEGIDEKILKLAKGDVK